MKLESKWIAILLVLLAVIILAVGNLTRDTEQNPEKPRPSSSRGDSPDNHSKASKTLNPSSNASIPKKSLFPDTSQQVKTDNTTYPRIELGKILGKGDVRFTHFKVGSRNVKDIFAENDHVIWFATSGGVIRYDIDKDEHRIFDNKVAGILSNGVFHVSVIDGKVFAGTYGGGLSVYDPKQDEWKNYNIPYGLADQFVYDVVKDRHGDIWIATWSGINRIRGGDLDDPKKWEMYTVENTQGGIPNPWVYAAREGVHDDMWFATEEGLAHYQDGKWQNWKHGDGLGADYELVKDTIQFTNDPAKASKHHARQKAEQGLQRVSVAYNPNYVISLAVTRDGTVWAGTWGGGLSRFDGRHWKNYTTHDGLPANHIFMLYIDDSGLLWIGTNHGLALYDSKQDSFSVMTSSQGLYADNVFSMLRTQDNNLWIGSFGGVARILPVGPRS
ncbi:MAG: regulator [Gammaproteobacteria bacterium]|nr:MAG: regulator [Gammaproteobacteria bacterium]